MVLNFLNQVIPDIRYYLFQNKLDANFSQFMVDIESTGAQPDLNHIVEISIVPFSLVPNVVLVSPPEYHVKFKFNLNQRHRFCDPQTDIWWQKQPADVREKVFSHFFDPSLNNANTLLEISKFITKVSKGNTEFWSKPNSFDFMFMQSFFKDNKVIFPFSYWIAKDMAGFCSGISFVKQKTLDYKIYKPLKRFKAHDSLNDCYFQLEWLQNAISDTTTDVDLELPF